MQESSTAETERERASGSAGISKRDREACHGMVLQTKWWLIDDDFAAAAGTSTGQCSSRRMQLENRLKRCPSTNHICLGSDATPVRSQESEGSRERESTQLSHVGDRQQDRQADGHGRQCKQPPRHPRVCLLTLMRQFSASTTPVHSGHTHTQSGTQ